MKQLELNLQKRLLIVEFEDMDHLENVISCDKQGIKFCSDNDEPTKLICKGLELTEEVAEELVHQSIHTQLFAHYVKGIPVNTYCYESAVYSFIFAIESQGWFWKNPLGISTEEIRQRHGDASDMFKEWIEYEFKTFNPDKTLIFEIV